MSLKPLALIRAFYAQELSPSQRDKSRERLRGPLHRNEPARDQLAPASDESERRRATRYAAH